MISYELGGIGPGVFFRAGFRFSASIILRAMPQLPPGAPCPWRSLVSLVPLTIPPDAYREPCGLRHESMSGASGLDPASPMSAEKFGLTDAFDNFWRIRSRVH